MTQKPQQGPNKGKRAAALRYDPARGDHAPRLLAKGEGLVAERLLERAHEAGIPIYEDKALVDALVHLELDAEVPPELYQVVAAVLAFVYRLDRAR